MVACLLCGSETEARARTSSFHDLQYQCPRCGHLGLTGEAIRLLDSVRQRGVFDPSKDKIKADAISHSIRSLWNEARGEKSVYINDDYLERLIREARLRSPADQADNLILWLGDQAERADDPAKVLWFEIGERPIARRHSNSQILSGTRSPQTPFSIRNSGIAVPSGTSFLVVDLSTGNRGAYWEAGFAEGLGRPVFYVCREDIMGDRKHLDWPHFDTNHMNTVPWSLDKLDDARKRLAATDARLSRNSRIESPSGRRTPGDLQE